MHLASPNMSSLSTLLLLLFLFCSRLPADNGQPLNMVNINASTCNAIVQEIRKQLEEPSPLSLDSIDSEYQCILRNASWRLTLGAFLRAAQNLTGKEKIKRSLEFLLQCRPKVEPTVTSRRKPILIKSNDWDDFRRTLQYYLSTIGELDLALNPRVPHLTSASVPGSSQHGTLGYGKQ